MKIILNKYTKTFVAGHGMRWDGGLPAINIQDHISGGGSRRMSLTYGCLYLGSVRGCFWDG